MALELAMLEHLAAAAARTLFIRTAGQSRAAILRAKGTAFGGGGLLGLTEPGQWTLKDGCD